MSKVTIIIPTHNRHHYLVRSVHWFLQGGYDVVIADSTEIAWKDPMKDDPRVTYIHKPGSAAVYFDKMVLAIELVKTPFAAICADDDFILFPALEACADYLEKNNQYVFCQGYAYLFQTIAGRTAVWPMLYDYHDVESSEWLQRVTAVKSSVYYGVNKTDILLSAFDFLRGENLSRNFKAGGLMDYALTSLVARNGKLKRLPIPFALREYSLVVQSIGTRPELLLDSELPNFFRALLNKLLQSVENAHPELERVLVRNFAQDFSDQLHYDLSRPLKSKRLLVERFPRAIQEWAELGMRFTMAVRRFSRKDYLLALSLFKSEDYTLFKKQIKKFPVKL